MIVSVIIPAHNPHPGRLARTLAALAAQTLPADQWETLLVDNASTPALDLGELPSPRPANLHLLRESELGLNAARRCGLRAARGEFCVLVDDDNVLAPDYLERAAAFCAANPHVGAMGGISRPEFAAPPPPWIGEFLGLLACRDLGSAPLRSAARCDPTTGRHLYPDCAPIGAGMCLRAAAARAWLDASRHPHLSDRRGNELTSGGDNDIILTLLRAGWEVAYSPDLVLTHLIPVSRTSANYLARLNHGIQKSWVQVLAKHDASPWAPVPPWSVPLRCARAWLKCRAWSGPAACIRWRGICGRFAGRARRPDASR